MEGSPRDDLTNGSNTSGEGDTYIATRRGSRVISEHDPIDIRFDESSDLRITRVIMDRDEPPTRRLTDFSGAGFEAARREVAAHYGLTVEELDDAAERARAAKETATPPAWPSEKWETSPEKAFRKQHAILAFMRRVW